MSNYKTSWADLDLMDRGGFVSLYLTESHQVKTKATIFSFFVFLSDGYRTQLKAMLFTISLGVAGRQEPNQAT